MDKIIFILIALFVCNAAVLSAEPEKPVKDRVDKIVAKYPNATPSGPGHDDMVKMFWELLKLETELENKENPSQEEEGLLLKISTLIRSGPHGSPEKDAVRKEVESRAATGDLR